MRAGTGNGRELKKERRCDGLLYAAQDACMAEELRVNRAATRLAVMGFVKVTCSRSGAFARDWADRVEKQLQWVGRNVLSVKDFTWHPDFMELEHVDEVDLADALCGEVELGRVKRHYYERVYKDQYSVTPEHFDVARRAATWFAIYFWRRACSRCRLRYETLEAKRWAVWEADFKAFDELTAAQLKARCAVDDVSAWRLEDLLLLKYGGMRAIARR